MNRALRAATMGALLLTSVTLTACGAGQVNQTSEQNRDKVGPSVQFGDLELRQVQLAYPGEREKDDPATGPQDESTFYEAGDDAELIVTIVNDGAQDVRLTRISAEGFSGVFTEEPPAEDATTGSGTTGTGGTGTGATGTASPTATPTAGETASPTAGETASPTATPTAGETATPTAGGTATPAAGGTATPAAGGTAAPTASETVSIVVPARSSLTIGLRQYDPGTGQVLVAPDTQRIFLADMSPSLAPLTPGLTVPVTFTFQGQEPVTVDALVSGPYVETTRGGAYDFQQGTDPGREPGTEAK